MEDVNDRQTHSALRELQRHLTRPATLAGLLGAILILVLAGPFGTLDSLGPAARTGYWGVLVAVTYLAGSAIDIILRQRLSRRHAAVQGGCIAVATALVVTCLVAGLNALLLDGAGGSARTLATIFAVALVLTLLRQVIIEQLHPATRAPTDESHPRILDRLPVERRGVLVALSVEDHYVRVRTTRGETLLLMRLSDAMRETAPTPGLQVHRSHWVARDAVAAVRRDGDRAILALNVGGDIPASRSHIPALKAAGLLPR